MLRKECRKWAIRVAREAKAISEMERRLNVLKISASRAVINGSRDVSAEQVEAKVEELEHVLRRTRTSKLKDETKISFLRKQLGAQVDKWLDDLPIRKVCLGRITTQKQLIDSSEYLMKANLFLNQFSRTYSY